MCARKMIDNVYALDELRDNILFGDITANRFQTRMCCLVPQQVEVEVDRTNMMTMFKLTVHQVASDESTRACDQNFHALSCLSAVTMTALLVFAGKRLSKRLTAHAIGKSNE